MYVICWTHNPERTFRHSSRSGHQHLPGFTQGWITSSTPLYCWRLFSNCKLKGTVVPGIKDNTQCRLSWPRRLLDIPRAAQEHPGFGWPKYDDTNLPGVSRAPMMPGLQFWKQLLRHLLGVMAAYPTLATSLRFLSPWRTKAQARSWGEWFACSMLQKACLGVIVHFEQKESLGEHKKYWQPFCNLVERAFDVRCSISGLSLELKRTFYTARARSDAAGREPFWKAYETTDYASPPALNQTQALIGRSFTGKNRNGQRLHSNPDEDLSTRSGRYPVVFSDSGADPRQYWRRSSVERGFRTRRG